MKKYVAEAIGTFVLVFFGCATVIFMKDDVGLLGVALAFGLTVVAMAYSIGHVSGAHLNPAVSTGVFFAGRMSSADYIGYVIAQVAGGIIAALALLAIVQGKTGGYDVATEGLAATGWSDYAMTSALAYEALATAMFVLVILGATQGGAPTMMAGLVIGLTLTLVHLAGINISGASVNPARSIGPAMVESIQGGDAISQLWLYIVGPLIGGAIGGLLHKAGITTEDTDD
ncbi:MAG: aquaporin [Paracoccaceae bacterium]